jgi:HPt (histidine-containing phosphotransfer) domain-containing protein
VALSANAVSGAREAFLEAGMNDFISKPIDPAVLNRALIRWLPADKVALRKASTGAEQAVPEDAGRINRAAGLKNAAEDAELYQQLLHNFKEEHSGDFEKIEAALAAGDRRLAHRLAHTLKSTAALIGAETLRQAAAAAETGLEENALGIPAGGLESLHTALTAVMSELADLSPAEADTPRKDSPKEAAGAETRERAARLVETLIPLLKTGNTDCLGYVAEIREALSPLSHESEALITEITNFEFKNALDMIIAIKGNTGL